MVADRQVDPVGIEGGGGISKHAADIERVIFARVEVGVVTDKYGHQQLLLTCLKDSLCRYLFAQRRVSSIE